MIGRWEKGRREGMRRGSGNRKGRKTGTNQYQWNKNIAKRRERQKEGVWGKTMRKEDRRMGERETRSQK